jgi:hypothetical protein
MSLFFIEEDPGQKQKRRRRDILSISIGIVVLVAGFFVLSRWETDSFLPPFSLLFVFTLFLAPAIQRLVVTANKWFVDINDNNIAFRTGYLKNVENLKIVDWKDIQWIKKEKDNSISLYQQSSFMENIALKEFSGNAQEKITNEIKERAVARDIQVVDF